MNLHMLDLIETVNNIKIKYQKYDYYKNNLKSYIFDYFILCNSKLLSEYYENK